MLVLEKTDKNNGTKFKVVFIILIHYFYDRMQQIYRIVKFESLYQYCYYYTNTTITLFLAN